MSSSVRIGVVVAALVILGCTVGGCLFLLHQEARDTLWSTPCGGGTLEIDYVRELNRFEGVTTNRHLEGRYAGRTFQLDGEPEPSFFRWMDVSNRTHGEGTEALHVFVNPLDLDPGDASAIEGCIEAAPGALLAALDANPESDPNRVWAGRRRIYWEGSAYDLVAVFNDRDHDKTLELQRNGQLTHIESFGGGGTSESWLGNVVDEDGALRIEWEHGRIPDDELQNYIDGDSMTLPERLATAR